MADFGLTSKLMTQAAAPRDLDELTVCQWQQSKCANSICKCVKAGLLCSPACGCGVNLIFVKTQLALKIKMENICPKTHQTLTMINGVI